MTIAMEPVAVWERGAVRHLITDVEKAALFLLHLWPKDHMTSRAHLAARKAALAALEGKATPDKFRSAFVKAAEEAGILAGPAEMPTHELPGHLARPWDMPWAGKKKRRKR